MECKFSGIEEYLKNATDEQVKALNEEHKKIVKDIRENYELWLSDDEFGIDWLDEEGLKTEIEKCENNELDLVYAFELNHDFNEIFDSYEYDKKDSENYCPALCEVFEWYQKNGYEDFDFCWNNVREKIDFLDIKLAAEEAYKEELRDRLEAYEEDIDNFINRFESEVGKDTPDRQSRNIDDDLEL